MSTSPQVAVLGCGLMGAAIARTFSQHVGVVVWNRTPAKAEALASDTVAVAASGAEAIAAAPVVVSVLSDYDALREVLAEVDSLEGRTVVGLSTSEPGDSRDLEALVVGMGGAYLDGGILAYPVHIGTPGCVIAYGGDAATWAATRDLLMLLGGGSLHVSEDVGGSGVVDAGLAGLFALPMHLALVEAVSYMARNGIAPESISTQLRRSLEDTSATLEEMVAGILATDHSTDQATVAVYADAAYAWRDSVLATGDRASMLAAAAVTLREAEAAGLGDLGFTGLARLAPAAAG
ncbi:NAD(P)-binding domain-containing protein [Nocardioides sp. GY 10127]|uniref:NAD(P)-binding domain-containing protein n=1 Tax=Nocardioides sp. GY 10127 TaxID=2569762 RepID=UPI0010A8F40D|nr:NAD(P)-binding domain-containing protein [Nocardioides sp. GY 10127]TIC79125.1 NAD(P)-dependent oxidoreductase [Nocardioides sp. GY 10127]